MSCDCLGRSYALSRGLFCHINFCSDKMLCMENGSASKAVMASVSGLGVQSSQINHFGMKKKRNAMLKWAVQQLRMKVGEKNYMLNLRISPVGAIIKMTDGMA